MTPPPDIQKQIDQAKANSQSYSYGFDNKRGGHFFELLPMPPILPTCGAKTKATGEPCRLTVQFEGARCRFHGGRSTGPKTPAGRAAIAAANRRRKGTRYRVAMPADPIQTAADLAALTPAQRRQWIEAETQRRAENPTPRSPTETAPKIAAPVPMPRDSPQLKGHPQEKLLRALLAMTPEQRAEVEANLRAQILGVRSAPLDADP